MEHKTRQYYVVAAIVLIGIAIYQFCHITGPVMFPDEFGYWANAAQFAGYDWSNTVSLQSYYSFGYSFLLLPLLKFIKDPFLMYKVAICGNIIFIYLSAVLLWKIADSMNPKNRAYHFFFCVSAVLYPSTIFYMQMTLTESLLTFLFIMSIWLLLQYERRKSGKYAVFFCLCVGYLYFVHMRTVGVLIAGALTLLIFERKGHNQSRKKIILCICIVVTCWIAGTVIKEFLQNGLYSGVEQELLNTNDYKGQISRIQQMISVKGITDFAISCVGKLFYLGISTCGTIYFALWRLMRKGRKSPVCLYILLSFLATFTITAVFAAGGGRADIYFYGRYNEFLIPIMLYMGLVEMSENSHVGRFVAGITCLHGGMAYALISAMNQESPESYHGFFVTGFSYVLKEYMPKISDYIIRPYVAGTVVMLLLAIVMGLFIRRKKMLIVYLSLFAGLYLYTGLSAGKKYLYDHSIDAGEDMALAEYAEEQMTEADTVLFVNSENDSLCVDNIQFCLKEHPLQLVEEKNFVPKEPDRPEFVFTYQNGSKENELRKYYDTVLNTYHFKLYYNKDKR